MEDNQFKLIMNKLEEMEKTTNERFRKIDKRFDKLEKELKETKNTLKNVDISTTGMIRLMKD